MTSAEELVVLNTELVVAELLVVSSSDEALLVLENTDVNDDTELDARGEDDEGGV